MMNYTFRYRDYLMKANSNISQIPEGISGIIEILDEIIIELPNMDTDLQMKLLPILIDVDAYISAHLSSILSVEPANTPRCTSINESKFLEIKAKAKLLRDKIK